MEKIKILLIVDDYVPHSIKIAAKMMHEMALRYKQMGYEVSVLTPDPLQKEPLIIRLFDRFLMEKRGSNG